MGRRKNRRPFKRASTLHLWTVTSGATNAKTRANFFSADPGPDLVAHGAAHRTYAHPQRSPAHSIWVTSGRLQGNHHMSQSGLRVLAQNHLQYNQEVNEWAVLYTKMKCSVLHMNSH